MKISNLVILEMLAVVAWTLVFFYVVNAWRRGAARHVEATTAEQVRLAYVKGTEFLFHGISLSLLLAWVYAFMASNRSEGGVVGVACLSAVGFGVLALLIWMRLVWRACGLMCSRQIEGSTTLKPLGWDEWPISTWLAAGGVVLVSMASIGLALFVS